MFDKMDPFALIDFTRAGVTKQLRGPTHWSGHKAPVWNWEFDIYYGGETGTIKEPDTLKVSIFEEDLTSNDHVGETTVIPISQLIDGNKRTTKE